MNRLRMLGLLVFIPLIILLSSPVFSDLLTVTTTADAGPGSLRQAIVDANNSGGQDLISFNIPTSEALHENDYYWWSIKPASQLPGATETILIDGTSQPTDETYNNPYGPVIELDGGGGTSIGLIIQANNCILKGLTVNRYPVRGIYIEGSNNTITECYVGTNITGEVALGNFVGIILTSANAYGNKIGDGTVSGRNIISGNLAYGIQISDNANNNEVLGNYIGTNVNGTVALANGFNGIYMSSTGGDSNKVGNGTIDGVNRIWWNNNDGIRIYSQFNTITRNSFFSNGDLGIKLEPGANGGITYPTIEAAVYYAGTGNVYVSGEAPANSTIELFISDDDASGYGEGKTYIASTASDGGGNWSTTLTGVSASDKLTATATDQNGNTSEFSLNKSISVQSLDHFVVYAPPTVVATETFILTVEAKDASGSTTTEVVGTTILSADDGSITPPSISDAQFQDDGIWSGSAALSKAGDRVIYATNFGAQGSIEVVVLNSAATIEDAGLGITIYIPAGAASDEVSITMSEVSLPGSPPQGYSVVGRIINFNSSVTQFLIPITVTMQISNNPNIRDHEVYYWTGSQWSDAGINIISITDTEITFTTTHLSIFAPFAIVMGKEVRFGPNPYDPDKDSFARFWYWLTDDETTKIYIIDMSGTVIWKKEFSAGSEGGKQGENHVDWYGDTMWSTAVADGAYLYKVIQGSKVIGEGKIAIIRR